MSATPHPVGSCCRYEGGLSGHPVSYPHAQLRRFAHLHQQSLTPLSSQVISGDVRFDNVVFGYNMGAPVLKGVSFHVPGEIVSPAYADEFFSIQDSIYAPHCSIVRS